MKAADPCCVLAMMYAWMNPGSPRSRFPVGSVKPSDCRPSQISSAVATWKIFGQLFDFRQRIRMPSVCPVIGSCVGM